MIWGSKPAQCRKVKEVGNLMIMEPTTVDQVNDNSNYNDLKVENFLSVKLQLNAGDHSTQE